MKIITVLVISIVSLFLSQASAQTEVPKGLKKGTIILADGSSLPGFIKDNIHNNASVIFISEADGRKKNMMDRILVPAVNRLAKMLQSTTDELVVIKKIESEEAVVKFFGYS